MKLLLDECLPGKLAKFLPGYDVTTAKRAGLCNIRNGALLSRAEYNYDVLITVDKNMSNQNRIANFQIGVIVVRTRSLHIDVLKKCCDKIVDAVKKVKKSQVIVVENWD